MTDAIAAYGTQLKLGDAGTPTEVFTAVSEVKDITGPGYTLDTIDVTAHSSPDGWEEVIAAFKRSGEVTFDLNYTPTDPTHDIATGVFSVLDAREVRNWQLVWPDDYGIAFSAYVTGFEVQSPVAEARTASVTMKPSGVPTPIEP